MSDDTAVTTPKLRDTRYYEKVSYPTLLLQLLSRAAGLLSRPPSRGGQDVLAVVAAADTIETIYYSLPAELREAVNSKLQRDFGPVVNAIQKCKEAWEQAVTNVAILNGKKVKIKRVNNITQLSMLPKLRATVCSGVLPLFLYRIVRHIVDENGFIIGADVIDLTPCIEAALGNTAVTPSEAAETLVKLYARLIAGKLVAPSQALMYTCVYGLRLRARAALRAIVDALNEAGLLIEKGEVWVGEA